MNIISNAAESIEADKGGVLSVKTRYLKKSSRVSIRFEDTGIGIAKKNVSKIFEPFFTTKKKGKGVGLGLSVAYGLIRDHGGTIYVTPGKVKGNTFTVRLPLKQSTFNIDQHGEFHE